MIGTLALLSIASIFHLQLPILALAANGVWVPNYIVPPQGTNPFNAVICTVTYNAPWFGTLLFYAVYASALIFVAATEGKFIRFSYASFGMIFLGIAFAHYGCISNAYVTVAPIMNPANILAPIAGFVLTLIASMIWG